ncbi:MAG: damage-inducible protein DinB [Eudoraea sp.]|nr:damage-inducible protein DinB [Eudoraea sp.]NNJ40520.1 damage-inducible protein DinB [Eudoraea sp.]
MKAFFHQLFDYNFYCNKKLIASCSEMKSVPDEVIRLFSHVLNAHYLWNARILNTKIDREVWQLHEVALWAEMHYQNQRATFEIIRNTDNFERRIDYQNSEGRMYSNSLQDILFHIINHSTHHRAQMATAFRNNNLEPLTLDYIFYKR